MEDSDKGGVKQEGEGRGLAAERRLSESGSQTLKAGHVRSKASLALKEFRAGLHVGVEVLKHGTSVDWRGWGGVRERGASAAERVKGVGLGQGRSRHDAWSKDQRPLFSIHLPCAYRSSLCA